MFYLSKSPGNEGFRFKWPLWKSKIMLTIHELLFSPTHSDWHVFSDLFGCSIYWHFVQRSAVSPQKLKPLKHVFLVALISTLCCLFFSFEFCSLSIVFTFLECVCSHSPMIGVTFFNGG